MESSRYVIHFRVLALLIAGCCIVLPALAANGTVTISYRGSGGGYVGDTIVFDGTNSAGNVTAIKITGPGLAAEGVPLYSLDGEAGTGNQADVKEGKWTFTWDTSRVDPSKLQTARYTFVVWDKDHPSAMATTSLLIKQPEFYLTAKPSSPSEGDYIELTGMAEKGVSYIKLDVTDASGNSQHTFMAPVSATGSFSYSFHADMPAGQYTITGTNPSMSKTLKLVMTLSASVTETTTAPQGQATGPQNPEASMSPTAGSETGSVPASAAPSASATTFNRAGIGIGTIFLALSVFSVIAICGLRKKNQ